jgi:TRAP-type C4-dicarboxylate transport system substrate-binding protein
MRSRATTLALLAVAAGPLAACGSGGSDKAGGVKSPVTLRIAAHKEHDYFATLFTDEVRRLSKGRIRVESIPGNGDNDPADVSVRFARQVGDGRYDLGVIDAPAWDELGVRSLEPLQAPFLISDQSLFRAVLASPLANRMLAGLRARHVVGLSLMMSSLQHPMGYEGPLTTPADFRGKRIRVPVSRLNDAVISALGATPTHLGFAQVGPSVARHELDGEEMITLGPPQTWLTANVTLFADALTVVVNERRYAKLADQQRRVLRTAAARAAERAAAVMAANSDAKLAPRQCARGRVVLASGADRAALEQATRPVYAELERDPQVKATIAAIRELKRGTPPEPAPRIPASCSRPASAARARERDPSFLDGTYRWRITRAGARKVGVDPDDAAVGTIAGMTLRGGAWAFEGSDGSRDKGTFTVVGNRIAFDWPAHGYTNTFTFKRRADGTLDLTPVPPMDPGDRLVTASSPWKRIGPSVRKVR